MKPASKRAKRINVSIDPRLLRTLDGLAKKAGLTRSGYLEVMIVRDQVRVALFAEDGQRLAPQKEQGK
jgi:metal-responsive CopG/Arc/MetJ family transcriptional regulator